MKPGSLCKRTSTATGETLFCQIISMYNHRDVGYGPQDVAIIPFIKAVWLSGESLGREFRSDRRIFCTEWEVISDI